MEAKRPISTASTTVTVNSDAGSQLQSMAVLSQGNHHHFRVHFLSGKKVLNTQQYTSVEDIKEDAFALYKELDFHNGNAILTHYDHNNVEVPLTSVPDLPKKDQYQNLFIRYCHPVCVLCENPFGILEEQLLFECPTEHCGEQYCNSCVQAVVGSTEEHVFACATCKEGVTPQPHVLIQKHIIWKNMCETYGVQSLFELQNNKQFVSCQPLIKSIEFRLIHLESRLDTFRKKLQVTSPDLFDEQLIKEVTKLCVDLRELADQMKDKDEEMKNRSADVENCLQKYMKGMRDFHILCHILVHIIEKLETNDPDITIDIPESRREHLREQYGMDRLEMLSGEQNINEIDKILQDLEFRRRCLKPSLETIRSSLDRMPDQQMSFDIYIHKAEKKLEAISDVESDLSCLRGNLRAIERCVDKYAILLRDGKLLEDDHDGSAQHSQVQDIPCFKYIQLLEKLCVRTSELEMEITFPTTVQLMKTWQNDHGTGDEFKPKVIELFQGIELDLNQLFQNENSIYSIPYKVGFIGHGSVGKSALAIELANAKQYSAMINTARSTFGHLQFDTFVYQHPHTRRIIPFTFVDIEGAIDVDESLSAGNYMELITRADCDLYIIVFAGAFSQHNRACQQYIEKLQRKCLLVRSKADLLFSDVFKERTGKDYKKETARPYDETQAVKQIRNQSLVAFDDHRLTNEIYLTAVACKDEWKDASWAQFDFEKLKRKLIHLAATDIRITRMCKLAILTSRTVINTCFRRGYIVSKTQYKWLAAGASLVPFLDELPAFFGREEIRQAFGVHDKSAIMNTIHGTKDSLEEYLEKKNIKVSKKILESGYFDYLESDKLEVANTHIQASSIYEDPRKSSVVKKARNVTRHGTKFLAVVAAISTSVDDILRFAIPAGTAALRVVSIVGIAVGVALAPVFAAWAAYSSGKRMTEHLHRLCNDLLLILVHFAVGQCNDHYAKTQAPTFSSVFEEISPDEDE